MDCVRQVVTVKFFADGTKLHSVFDDNVTPAYLQSCWSAINEWSEHWHLTLSPSKCTILHVRPFGSTSNYVNFTHHTGSNNLPSVDSVTDLGVTYCNR